MEPKKQDRISHYRVKDEKGSEFVILDVAEYTKLLNAMKDKGDERKVKEEKRDDEDNDEDAELEHISLHPYSHNKELAKLTKKLQESRDERHDLYRKCALLEDLAFAGMIAKPKFFRKCPTCGKRLNKQFLRLFANYNYYTCECGYEYARQSSWDDGV